MFKLTSSTNFVEAQNHPQLTNATILLDSTNLGDKAYQPNPIEIPVWGSVSWTNDDRIAHSVTATEGEFDSAVMQPYQKCTRKPRQVARSEEHTSELQSQQHISYAVCC